MENLKRDDGHTLLEIVIVLTMLGIILVFLWTSYLSINRAYIRADKKAQNLEDARVIINHLTDNFQIYGGCKVLISDGTELEEASSYINANPGISDEGFRTVKEIIFEDPANPSDKIIFSYDEGAEKINWVKDTSVEIANEVKSFTAKKNDNLIEFKIGVIKEGHGVIADQKLELGTTLNLKYMPGI